MRNIFILLIFLITTFVNAGEIRKEFKASQGGTLEADIKTGGSIYVMGWDKDKVEVIVNHRGNKLDEDIGLEIEETHHGVSINVYSHGNVNADLKFEVKVPSVYDVDLKTMGGELRVAEVEGNLRGETMGGEINLEQLKGQIKFSTMGGNVELKDSDVGGKVSTMGGEILFDNVIGDIDGSSMGGNVTYKNVSRREGNKPGKEVHISTMGGNIDVQEAMSGANVSTMGGNIEIRKAAEYVKASTMGGNIDIDKIDGWIKASTMGGDVTVQMTGDPDKGERDVDIRSMGGDIDLTLPEGISAEFDIRISYSRNSRQDFEINSDFPFKISEDKEWNYHDGEPFKEIKGLGKTGDGKNTIRVSTHNGDIRIRKGN